MSAIRVRRKLAESWLDPESAGLLGWKLGKRLWLRVQGREGRFITLTYRRERFANAQDCFDRARSQKHVSRFMRKLGRLLGMDLRGKWLCKLEFQKAGWVHWHIVLCDVGFIPKHLFRQIFDTWGHGGIDVKPLTEENCKYLTKYVAKDGSIPGWVYDYPAKSIKVVRPSQGFWNDDQAAKARERTASRKRPDVKAPEKGEWYVPVGAKVGPGRGERCLVEAYVEDRTFFGRTLYRTLRRSVVGSTADVVRAISQDFDGLDREEHDGCTVFCGEARDVRDAFKAAEREPTGARAVPSEATAAEEAPPRGGPLFLRGTGKRAGWWRVWHHGKWRQFSPQMLAGRLSKWWAANAPWWVKLDWEQDGRLWSGVDGWPPDAKVSVSCG